MSNQASGTSLSQPAELASNLIQLSQAQSATLPVQLLTQLRSRVLASCGSTTELKERWKYTPARRYFESMLDSQRSASASAPPSIELDQLPSGCTWRPIDGDNLQKVTPLLEDDGFWQRYPLADLISQSPSVGHCLEIDSSQSDPLNIRLNPGVGFVVIRLAPQTQATVTFEYAEHEGFAGHWIATDIGPGASLHQALLAESKTIDSKRWLLTQARLQENSSFFGHVHALSEGSQRLETHLQLQGQGAQAELTTASITAAKASFDHQVVMEHQAPNCQSQQRIHNIADGGSKNSFNGRIHIHPGAHGTNAQLQNRNLAIADGAEINTKPELEIYNDNVSCSHGATIGQLDEQALFYLRSRGVPPAQARDLLLRAFIAECNGGAFAEVAKNAADELLNGALRR